MPGTHDLVVDLALRYTSPPGRALDLGAGTGALAERLKSLRFDVLAVDVNNEFLAVGVVYKQLDLNGNHFNLKLPHDFDVVTAIDVIEHLENPVAFLRGLKHLLANDGIAIVTTPNVENIPARLKFLLSGKLRMADELSPSHISPVFYDLFIRQYLPLAGLSLVEHQVYPKDDFPQTTRRWMVPLFKALGRVLKGRALLGDTNVFVLRRAK